MGLGFGCFFVLGIIGNAIYMVYADIRKRKMEKMPERVSVDYNPDYGIDYGEGEIKDRNDYYCDEDVDPALEMNE